MVAGTRMWVPHICQPALSERRAARGESNRLADVGKTEGPVSDLPSPVSFSPSTPTSWLHKRPFV